jgi:hypothetical protein
MTAIKSAQGIVNTLAKRMLEAKPQRTVETRRVGACWNT